MSMIWYKPEWQTFALVTSTCVVATEFLTICFISPSVSRKAFSSLGVSVSKLYKNLGSLHHLLSVTSSLAGIPRKGISARFCTSGQKFRDSGDVSSRILWTLLITYYFKGLLFWIQHNTVIESTQNTVFNSWRKAFSTVLAEHTRIVAPTTSSRGILRVFNGATFVLDAIQLTSTRPSS